MNRASARNAATADGQKDSVPATGILQRKCACGHDAGGACEECRKQELQRKAAGEYDSREAPRIVHDVVRSSGQALDNATRAFMEDRLGHSFASVQVHTDVRAASSARAVNALAYTVGRHVVFDTGRFAPATPAGRQLLAHELMHVVQQNAEAGPSRGVRIGEANADSEGEADRAADAVSTGARAPAAHRVAPGLMRQSPRETKVRRYFVYDRSNFADRFDGEVDADNDRVTLVMRLNIEDYGKDEGKEERIAAFRTKAKELLQRTWSHQYALQSVCHGGEDKFEANVRVVMTSQNPDHTIRVWEQMPGESSSSTDWQHGDLDVRERKSLVLKDPKKPPTKDNVQEMTFHQVPAAHEFGHLMGLGHIVCPGNEERCYGVTAEQKMDIMGYGSVVSKRDYEPFVRIMKRYGRDSLPSECNDWRLVEAG